MAETSEVFNPLYLPQRRAVLFTGNANPDLAKAVASGLGIELEQPILDRFADGEVHCSIEESVRGKDVYIMQSHGGDGMGVDTAITEQEFLISAAKGASARRVIAISPYLGYSRQDKKLGREPPACKVVLKRLESAGAEQIVCVDLHSEQIPGFAEIPVANLQSSTVLRNAILPRLRPGVVIVSPDAGRVKASEKLRDKVPAELEARVAYIAKIRPDGTKNKAEAKAVVGKVAGSQCVIFDDIIDTGGTLIAAVNALKDHDADEVLVVATHGVFSEDALERIAESQISHMVITDTRAHKSELTATGKIAVATMAGVISEAVHEIHTDGSISKLFNGHEK